MANMAQAVRMALHYGETHLGVTDVFGEDVGPPLGGVFTATQGLAAPRGTRRSTSAASSARRWASPTPAADPCARSSSATTRSTCIDLFKIAGNQRWASGGGFDMPLVVMTPNGAGIRGSLYHSHSFESWASRLPGWKIVMPSNAARRLRPHARGDQRPEPGAGAAAEGAAAREGRRAHPRRTGRRGRAEPHDRRPGRRPHRLGADVAGVGRPHRADRLCGTGPRRHQRRP